MVSLRLKTPSITELRSSTSREVDVSWNLLPRICYPDEGIEEFEFWGSFCCPDRIHYSLRWRTNWRVQILGLDCALRAIFAFLRGRRVKSTYPLNLPNDNFILLDICVFFWLFVLFLWLIYLDINIEIFSTNYLINITKNNYESSF